MKITKVFQKTFNMLNIKDLRLKLNLNQDDFVRKIGKSKNTILNWEKGKTFPNQKDLEIISKTFGINEQKNIYEIENNHDELYVSEETEKYQSKSDSLLIELIGLHKKLDFYRDIYENLRKENEFLKTKLNQPK